MESGLKMNFKTKGKVTAGQGCARLLGCMSRMRRWEGAAPLSPALLGSCACFGASRALSSLLPPQINPALPGDKRGVGGERSR